MTRREFKRNILLRLAETPDQNREPLFLDELLRMSADHVAMQSDCLQRELTADIDGTPTALGRFCLPDEIYKLTAVKVTMEDTTERLYTYAHGTIVNRRFMDSYRPTWQTDPQTGDVQYVVVERPDVHLYPNPEYDATSGIVFYGFCTPGAVWGSNTNPDDDDCPMPSYSWPAIELYACLQRCAQYPTKENIARYSLFERQYRDALARCATAAQQEYAQGSRYGGRY